MDINDIKFNRIYKAVDLPEEAEVYGYVRVWKDNEVGFSVLDEPTCSPDFSNCGVFWVSPEVFLLLFKEYK